MIQQSRVALNNGTERGMLPWMEKYGTERRKGKEIDGAAARTWRNQYDYVEKMMKNANKYANLGVPIKMLMGKLQKKKKRN